MVCTGSSQSRGSQLHLALAQGDSSWSSPPSRGSAYRNSGVLNPGWVGEMDVPEGLCAWAGGHLRSCLSLHANNPTGSRPLPTPEDGQQSRKHRIFCEAPPEQVSLRTQDVSLWKLRKRQARDGMEFHSSGATLLPQGCQGSVFLSSQHQLTPQGANQRSALTGKHN